MRSTLTANDGLCFGAAVIRQGAYRERAAVPHLVNGPEAVRLQCAAMKRAEATFHG